jgi:hypothetical protein
MRAERIDRYKIKRTYAPAAAAPCRGMIEDGAGVVGDIYLYSQRTPP